MKIFPANEGASGLYRGILKDDATPRQPIPAGQITLAKLTLYVAEMSDLDDENIVNERNDQDCLNTNGITIDSEGVIEWRMEREDFKILSGRRTELHVARVRFEYSSLPTLYGVHEVAWRVTNLRRHVVS